MKKHATIFLGQNNKTRLFIKFKNIKMSVETRYNTQCYIIARWYSDDSKELLSVPSFDSDSFLKTEK